MDKTNFQPDGNTPTFTVVANSQSSGDSSVEILSESQSNDVGRPGANQSVSYHSNISGQQDYPNSDDNYNEDDEDVYGYGDQLTGYQSRYPDEYKDSGLLEICRQAEGYKDNEPIDPIIFDTFMDGWMQQVQDEAHANKLHEMEKQRADQEEKRKIQQQQPSPQSSSASGLPFYAPGRGRGAPIGHAAGLSQPQVARDNSNVAVKPKASKAAVPKPSIASKLGSVSLQVKSLAMNNKPDGSKPNTRLVYNGPMVNVAVIDKYIADLSSSYNDVVRAEGHKLSDYAANLRLSIRKEGGLDRDGSLASEAIANARAEMDYVVRCNTERDHLTKKLAGLLIAREAITDRAKPTDMLENDEGEYVYPELRTQGMEGYGDLDNIHIDVQVTQQLQDPNEYLGGYIAYQASGAILYDIRVKTTQEHFDMVCQQAGRKLCSVATPVAQVIASYGYKLNREGSLINIKEQRGGLPTVSSAKELIDSKRYEFFGRKFQETGGMSLRRYMEEATPSTLASLEEQKKAALRGQAGLSMAAAGHGRNQASEMQQGMLMSGSSGNERSRRRAIQGQSRRQPSPDSAEDEDEDLRTFMATMMKMMNKK